MTGTPSGPQQVTVIVTAGLQTDFMLWLGRFLKDHIIPTPLQRAGTAPSRPRFVPFLSCPCTQCKDLLCRDPFATCISSPEQMPRVCPAPQKWNLCGRRSMPRWKPTRSRSTPSSQGGECPRQGSVLPTLERSLPVLALPEPTVPKSPASRVPWRWNSVGFQSNPTLCWPSY